MVEDQVRVCHWCYKEFTSYDLPLDTYNLHNAGTHVCLECADKFEDAEVKLGDKVYCYWNNAIKALTTANGHILPISTPIWKTEAQDHAHCLDSYGRRWTLKRKHGSLFKLTPTRSYKTLWV